MKLFIVEDDEFLNQAYKAQFKEPQYKVEIATDGRTALERLKDYTPDVIILDIVLPVMDGLSVLEKIKADDKLKKIPIIVASNLDHGEDIQRALVLGASDYIMKGNVSLEEVAKKVAKYVG